MVIERIHLHLECNLLLNRSWIICGRWCRGGRVGNISSDMRKREWVRRPNWSWTRLDAGDQRRRRWCGSLTVRRRGDRCVWSGGLKICLQICCRRVVVILVIYVNLRVQSVQSVVMVEVLLRLLRYFYATLITVIPPIIKPTVMLRTRRRLSLCCRSDRHFLVNDHIKALQTKLVSGAIPMVLGNAGNPLVNGMNVMSLMWLREVDARRPWRIRPRAPVLVVSIMRIFVIIFNQCIVVVVSVRIISVIILKVTSAILRSNIIFLFFLNG